MKKPNIDSNDAAHSPDYFHALELLQLLQNHSRTNMTAMIARRSSGAFTMQSEAAPEAACAYIAMIVYPVNPFSNDPAVRRMLKMDVKEGLENDRFVMQDSRNVRTKPDVNGNYMYWPDMPEFDQVNAFYYANFTLRMFEKYANRSIPWAFGLPRLVIDPYSGQYANAFYHELEGKIGFQTFRTHEGTIFSTAQSADVVSHETAHAVLDGLRDLYNESFGLVPRAFHESFSDISSILVALYDDALIQHLMDLTGGNLKRTTFLTELAENLFNMAVTEGEHFIAHSIYLRNAFNDFRDLPFDQLPPYVRDSQAYLSRQIHNYSRVFSGACYDLIVQFYDLYRQNLSNYVSLFRARDDFGQLLITAIELGPLGEFDFSDMARAFLTADQILFEGQYEKTIREVFAKRNILSDEAAQHHLEGLKKLPYMPLPEAITSQISSLNYLQNTISKTLNNPELDQLFPLSTYRNGNGYLYMNFFSSQSIILDDPRFHDFVGTRLDVFGGLTLMFDKEDRLRSVCYRPVNDEDIRQIRILVGELIEMGSIVRPDVLETGKSLPVVPQALILSENIPPESENKEKKLVKYPANIDRITDWIEDVGSIIKRWRL